MTTINNISLYIPLVFHTITQEEMIQIFSDKKIGKVVHIDFVKNEKKNLFKAAYIHFENWFDLPQAHQLQQNVLNGLEARIVYTDAGRYWIVLKNTSLNIRNRNIYLSGENKQNTQQALKERDDWDLLCNG